MNSIEDGLGPLAVDRVLDSGGQELRKIFQKSLSLLGWDRFARGEVELGEPAEVEWAALGKGNYDRQVFNDV